MWLWVYYILTAINGFTSWPVIRRNGLGPAVLGALALVAALALPSLLELRPAVFLGLLLNAAALFYAADSYLGNENRTRGVSGSIIVAGVGLALGVAHRSWTWVLLTAILGTLIVSGVVGGATRGARRGDS